MNNCQFNVEEPRGKMLFKGTGAMSDGELVALMVGNNHELGKRVLEAADFNLSALAKMSATQIAKIKGVGMVKATCIVAAMEIGRRRKMSDEPVRPKVGSSREAYELLCADMMDLPHEEFWALYLNRANRLIKKERISVGGVSGTVADPKLIYKYALENLASGIIVAHNHPSGNRTASQSDIDLTRKLKDAGKFMEIQMLDHLIICGQKYFSFADEGML